LNFDESIARAHKSRAFDEIMDAAGKIAATAVIVAAGTGVGGLFAVYRSEKRYQQFAEERTRREMSKAKCFRVLPSDPLRLLDNRGREIRLHQHLGYHNHVWLMYTTDVMDPEYWDFTLRHMPE
jgi:hypothetical protein